MGFRNLMGHDAHGNEYHWYPKFTVLSQCGLSLMFAVASGYSLLNKEKDRRNPIALLSLSQNMAPRNEDECLSS